MPETPADAFPLRRYLAIAGNLIFENTFILWTLGGIGLFSFATELLRETTVFIPLNILVVVMATVATPIFYGIYYRLLDDSYTSVSHLARVYIPSYIWLLVRMYLPAIVIVSLPAVLSGQQTGVGGYLEIGLVGFSMLYLFVIPWFYHSGQQRGAIYHGIHFLVRHLSASTPLLLTVLLLEATVLLVQRAKSGLLAGHPWIIASLDFFVFYSASLIDLFVFIILILIVRDTKPEH